MTALSMRPMRGCYDFNQLATTEDAPILVDIAGGQVSRASGLVFWIRRENVDAKTRHDDDERKDNTN